MNALAQSATPSPQPAAAPLLRTLVLCDLVDSTALVERLGDQHAAELFRKHDRLARALLGTHGGREIDKTDGFLLMFDRPVQAVAFALDYQRALKQLGADEHVPLAARVGVHVGDILTWDNAPEDVAKGAKLVEVEGLVKPIASRLMQLALPNQILLSGVAYALAHRAQGELGAQLDAVRWRTHGRYRFKGIPDPIPVFEVGDENLAPLKAPPWSGKAHRETPFWRRPGAMLFEGVALLALLVIPAWYLFKPEPAIAFANRDWVVVGDLKNLTGDARFDESIDTAFRIGLEQSRYVNVLSDLKTRETVQLMQKDPDKTAIDRAIGSEIALRDGARALILPTVAEIGGRVRVTAEVIDPNTQTTVYSESADGAGAGSVLPSLDKVNQKLRVRLGEALATVSNESKPLEKVATKNLDALRAYSLGAEAYDRKRGEAISLYEQALKLDPDFALARIGLARALFVVDQNAAAREQIRLAATVRDRLSPRDALYVDAWQATFGPPAPALEKWKTLATLYPDFFPAAGSYAFFVWQKANRFDDAIEAVKKSASPFNPKRGVSDYLLGILYLGNERYADARDSFARADAVGDAQHKEFYSATYAAQRQFEKAKATLAQGNPGGVSSEDIDVFITRIAFAVDQGDLAGAMDTLAVAKTHAGAVGPRKIRQFLGIEATLKALSAARGIPQGALGDYAQSELGELKHKADVDYADTVFHVLLAGYLAARLDDVKLTSTLLAEIPAETRNDDDPMLRQMLRVVEAEKMRAGGNAIGAIAALKPLLDGSELCVVHVALMDAYGAAEQIESASKEARWLAEHRGRAYAENNVQRMLTPFNVALSNIALLRMAELSATQGRKDEARLELAKFRKAWPRNERIDFLAPRLEKLKAVL